MALKPVLFAVAALAGLILVPAAAAQTRDDIREAQSLLVRADLDPGPIDGAWGARTERALVAFLDGFGETFDGTLSENELLLLRAAPYGAGFRQRPHTTNGRPIDHVMDETGLTTFPGRDELPQWLDPPPNDITLSYFFNLWLQQRFERAR